MKYTILIVDDDKDICQIVEECAKQKKYDYDIAYTGEEGLEYIKGRSYQLVVLNVMLPGLNGFHILEEIRKVSKVPVLMFTAKGESMDKVRGLKLGADDYLTKPFNIEELMARMESNIRRYTQLNDFQEIKKNIYLKNMQIEYEKRKVIVNGKEIQLTGKEFDLLYMLADGRGRIFTKKQIYSRIWEEEYNFDDGNLMAFISRLRKKIQTDTFDYIQNIRGVGYRVNPEVLQ